MPQVYLSSFAGAGAQFFSNSGVPLSGGKIFSYAAGTTTPQATYTSSSGLTPHSNPIILDSAGRVPGGEIWLPVGVDYKFVLYTATDVLIASYDNISSIVSGSAQLDNFTGTGAQVAFTLTSAPVDENSTNVYVSGVYQQKNTYGIVGTTLTFSQAPPLGTTIEIMYF